MVTDPRIFLFLAFAPWAVMGFECYSCNEAGLSCTSNTCTAPTCSEAKKPGCMKLSTQMGDTKHVVATCGICFNKDMKV